MNLSEIGPPILLVIGLTLVLVEPKLVGLGKRRSGKARSVAVRSLTTPQEAWIAMRKAKKNRMDVRITYQRSEFEPPTIRTITPMATYDGAYVIAHCHLKDRSRTFRLDKVKQVELVPRDLVGREAYRDLDDVVDRSNDYPDLRDWQ